MIRIYLQVLLAIICSITINAQLAIAKNIEINIYSINDFHGALRTRQDAPGIAFLAGAIKDVMSTSSNNVLVAAGDLFGTTVDAKDTGGLSTVLAFNELGVECIAVGNHEFDYSRKLLNKQQRIAEFPFLAANIKAANGNNMFKAYKIIEKDGIKIAFIGMITQETLLTATKNNLQGLEFLNPQDILPQYISEVRAQGADIVVLLAHIGSRQNKSGVISDEVAVVLANIQGLDSAISAHTHEAVNGLYNNIAVVQAKCYGQLLSHIKISYSAKQKSIVSIDSKLINVADKRSFIPDTPMNSFIQPYLQAADEKYGSVLAINEQVLTNNRFQSSTLANCFVDIILQATNADIALLNAGGVRKDYLPAGSFTLRNLIDIFPFDNSVVVSDVRGADIIAALNYGITNYKYGHLRFSGLQVVYNPSLPTGNQVVKVRLSDGSSLNPDKYYKVATVDFLLDGGDGFSMFKAAKNKEVLGQLSELLAVEIKKNGRISYGADIRLLVGQE